MAMVLDAFVSIFLEKLVDKAIAEIIFLLGVKREIKDLRKNLDIIKLVLVDAETKKIEDKAINCWLGELRDLMYDADDLLDDCRIQADIVAAARATSRRARIKARLRSVPGLSHLFSVRFRHEIGTRIQEMNSTLERLNSRIPILQLLKSQPKRNGCRYNHSRKIDACPILLDDDIVGINDDATELVDQITGGSTHARAIFAITGMPGIGKTTLAKKVYSDPLVQNHFDILVWYCVSSNCQGEELLKEIISSIKHNYKEEERERGNSEYVNQSEPFSKLKEIVKNRRVFIVLDDIWDDHVWEEYLRVPLYNGAVYSRILITTRNQHVAMKMKVVHTHHMGSMLPINGWLMLCKIVFEEDDKHDMDELKEIGMKIVKECKGLPLAIKVVGGVLKTIGRTPAAWSGVLSSRTWLLQDLPKDVQPGLLLSYEDLPSHLKQCFIYCSLFPEDFKFHQSTLVQMWIAEGFIKKVKGKEIEDLGEEYYNELVMRNVLQVVPDYYDGLGCKMHDLLRSVALFVSQNEYIYRDSEHFPSNTDSTRRRHLSFIKKEVEAIPEEIMEHDCIRTLLLSRNPRIKTIPPELLNKLRRLRVLDLTYTGIETLPDSLGDLIHLRFLNISFTKLRKLPDSMKNLKNLETLKANGSKYLRSLPTSLVDLCNLRHLTLGAGEKQLHNMPIGMDKLKNLRILNGFVANDGTRNGEYHYTPNMKELRDLCELTELTIYKLERIASREEAEEATLENKTKLKYLKLSCSHQPKTNPPTDEEIAKIEKVFVGIKTSKNLTRIHIEGFFGKGLPAHITSGSLCQVTWLRLDDCRFIRQLPSLGDMPRLEILQIRGATSVVELSSEFVGSLKFPKLQDLYLWGMTKLERMFEVKQGAFSCLKKLHILKSPKLKSLPKGLDYAMCLKQLVIEDVESLELIQNLNSISELKIKGNSRLRSIANLPSLNIMNISECSALKHVKNVGSLSYLFISEAGMKTLPQWLKNTTSPKKLDVIGSKELVLRTYKSAEDWNLIENCSRVVTRSCDGSKYMSYGKEPYYYICDLTDRNGASSSSSFTIIGNVDSFMDEEYWGRSSLPL